MPVEFKPISVSKTEATVLGFNAAGWTALEQSHREKQVKVYGFGNTPVSDEQSTYMRNHEGKDISEQKLGAISKFATSSLIAGFERLSMEDKNVLISAFNIKWKEIYDQEPIPLLDNSKELSMHLSENTVDVSEFLLCLGSTLAFSYDKKTPEGKSLLTVGANKELTGNEAVEKAANILNDLEEMRPHTLERFKELVTGDHSGLQSTMWLSKRVIADTLQENIRRYHAGEPLIPIKMVISARSNASPHSPKGFSVSQSGIKNKDDVNITPTELRFIYKLIKETPDEVIKHIMQNTVSFLERTGEKIFEKADAPWEKASWTDRPRGQRGLKLKSYAERAEDQLPVWIKQLIESNKRLDDEAKQKGHGPK